MGSVLGRIKFSAWCLLVPLWSTFVYGVDAFLLWGGGYLAQEGALDFSGGYVIHMSAGVSGFVAAWVLGPRLLRDRQHAVPVSYTHLFHPRPRHPSWKSRGEDPLQPGQSRTRGGRMDSRTQWGESVWRWVVTQLSLLRTSSTP